MRFGRRAARHVAWRAERVRVTAVDLLRRGDRTVITTPEVGLRFGNWLYLWMVAHARTAAGSPTVIREVDDMRPWLERFPRLRDLTVADGEVRFHDRRDWEGEFRYQRFGVDFSRAELRAFVREVLAPDIRSDPSHRVVINIRRGDYYEGDFRRRYGFDLEGYVSAGLSLIGLTDRILVVSDDPAWCREHLGAILAQSAPSVVYADHDPIGNFIAVAAGRRLIGTNSTFSYWGGYVSDALHADAEIVMPRFHARMEGGSDAFQLDPDWTIVDGYC